MRFPDDVPTLTDGVVTLRAHREDDVAGVLEQSTDPLSQAWTTVPVPYTPDHAKRFVREVMPGGWLTDQEWGFAVEYDGRYAATVTLRNEGERRAEIAYASHPRIRGTGAMERALRLLLGWGFDGAGPGLHTVVWWANRGNWPSRRLAWRLGFATDATLLRGSRSAASCSTPGAAPCSAPTSAGPGTRGRWCRRSSHPGCRCAFGGPAPRTWTGSSRPARTRSRLAGSASCPSPTGVPTPRPSWSPRRSARPR